MDLPILYGNRASGHSYKVKLALSFLDIEHKYLEVDLQTTRKALGLTPMADIAMYLGNDIITMAAKAAPRRLFSRSRETSQVTPTEAMKNAVERNRTATMSSEPKLRPIAIAAAFSKTLIACLMSKMLTCGGTPEAARSAAKK